MAGVHDTAKLQALLADMLVGATRSCRALAAELEVGKNTIWRWRSKIMMMLHRIDAPSAERVVDAQRLIVRESRKASREWVRHASDPTTWPAPDRPRWIDVDSGRLPEPLPRERFRVPMLAIIDERRVWHAMLAPERWPSGSTQRDDIGTSIGAPDPLYSRLVDDRVNPRFAGDRQSIAACQPISAVEREGRNAARFAPPVEALRRFLQPFRGPATTHLPGYLAWFNTALSGSLSQSCEPALAMALPTRPTQYGDIPIAPP